MSIPTQSSLKRRTATAEAKLKQLKAAHDAFLMAWDSIAAEKQDLKAELTSVMDKVKLKKITKHISSL